MTDHWQVIEDALNSERVAICEYHYDLLGTENKVQRLAPIDAALAFVREMRHVPTGELLPCPFCGEEPDVQEFNGSLTVWCGNDDCGVAEKYSVSRERAIEVWNRRVPTERTPSKFPPGLEFWDNELDAEYDKEEGGQ